MCVVGGYSSNLSVTSCLVLVSSRKRLQPYHLTVRVWRGGSICSASIGLPYQAIALEQLLRGTGFELLRNGIPTLSAIQAYLRHGADAARTRDDSRIANLCTVMGRYLWLVGSYAAARPYLERAGLRGAARMLRVLTSAVADSVSGLFQ